MGNDDRLSFSGIDDSMKKTDKQRQNSFNNHTVIKKPTAHPTPSSNKTNMDNGFAGPLLIYENEKPQPTGIANETSDLQNLHAEHEMMFNPNQNGIPISESSSENFDNESPPYQHIGSYNPWGTPPNRPPKDEILVKPLNENQNKSPSFMGPFNPDYKMPVSVSKAKKSNKTTTPSNIPNKQKGDRFRPPFPNIPQQQNPFQQPQFNTIQRPEEILQIINQHPELANYPSGSVFEIHNYDPNTKFPQSPVGRPPLPPPPPVGPYLVNQVDTGSPANFPQNIPVDQIIKHVQNGQIPPGLSRPLPGFGQNPQFAPNTNPYAPHGLQIPLINGQLNSNQTSGGNCVIF